MATEELRRVTVVLDQPQDPVNIGAVVRAMKNMGLSRLHLIQPADFNPYRIQGVAHTGLDIIESTRIFDGLADGLSGSNLVVGTTARGRSVRRNYRRPREAAGEIIDTVLSGRDVALLLGREDRGLSNEQLDLCDRVVVIPTHPEHSSLNLAQAFLLIAYELWVAAGEEQTFKEPRRTASRAGRDELEGLFKEIEASLDAVDFFKAHNVTPIMRTVREVLGRADLDERELLLFKAMAYEIRNYMRRHGLGE